MGQALRRTSHEKNVRQRFFEKAVQPACTANCLDIPRAGEEPTHPLNNDGMPQEEDYGVVQTGIRPSTDKKV